jgi:hypothetical protein
MLSIQRQDYINKRLSRLRDLLSRLNPYDKKKIHSTRVAIKRWEDILAGRRADKS